MAGNFVTTYIDNQNGIYRINKPIVFFGVILMQFIFVYVIIKVSQYPLLKEIRIFLSDLEAQVLEGTQKLTEMKKYLQRWRIIFAILATLLFYGEYGKRFSLAHKILIL